MARESKEARRARTAKARATRQPTLLSESSKNGNDSSSSLSEAEERTPTPPQNPDDPFTPAAPLRSPDLGSSASAPRRALSLARRSPSRTPRKPIAPRACGARRAVPCIGCVRSAIAGRSNGECFDNKSGGDRCFRCASGHTCRALPSSAVSACLKFVEARVNGASRSRLNALRSAARVALEDVDDDHSSDDDDPPDNKPALKPRPRRGPDSDDEHGGTSGGGLSAQQKAGVNAYQSLMELLMH